VIFEFSRSDIRFFEVFRNVGGAGLFLRGVGDDVLAYQINGFRTRAVKVFFPNCFFGERDKSVYYSLYVPYKALLYILKSKPTAVSIYSAKGSGVVVNIKGNEAVFGYEDVDSDNYLLEMLGRLDKDMDKMASRITLSRRQLKTLQDFVNIVEHNTEFDDPIVLSYGADWLEVSYNYPYNETCMDNWFSLRLRLNNVHVLDKIEYEEEKKVYVDVMYLKHIYVRLRKPLIQLFVLGLNKSIRLHMHDETEHKVDIYIAPARVDP